MKESNVEVDYIGFGCRFRDRVEAGCNGVVYLSDHATIWRQPLQHLLSSSFLLLRQYHSELLG